MQTEQDLKSDAEFVKKGVVVPGKTPSAVSGAESETIKQGEACRVEEDPKDMDKLAAMLNE